MSSFWCSAKSPIFFAIFFPLSKLPPNPQFLFQPVTSARIQPVTNGFIGSSHQAKVTTTESKKPEGAADSGVAAQADQQQTTPRKSKSMGRITGDKPATAVAAEGSGPSSGVVSGGGTAPVVASENIASKPPPGPSKEGPWYGHRRVPSDGVAWRRSKGS